MYRLEDLASAKKELERWNEAFANDRSNNPRKYEAQRRDARIQVRRIEEFLKQDGVLQKSESELLSEELDRLYPDVKSRTIVSHNGKAYQVRYFPLVESRSRKSVKEWGHSWVAM